MNRWRSRVRRGALAAILSLFIGLPTLVVAQEDNGPSWLAQSRDPRALDWVARARARTLATLTASPHFAPFEAAAERILNDPTRPLEVRFIGEHAYQYWQDRERPLGVWRRTPRALYLAGQPEWDTVIDLDDLAAREKIRWFFAGADCRGRRCLVRLADNGEDATIMREFDLTSKRFVDGGFALPVSRGRTWWIDDDTLLVAPAASEAPGAFRPPARTLARWRRGTPVTSAATIFAIEPNDSTVSASLINTLGDGAFLAARHIDPQKRAYRIVRPDGSGMSAPLPPYARTFGVSAGRLMMSPDIDWSPAGSGKTFPAGTLVAVPVDALFRDGSVAGAELVYAPAPGDAVRGVVSGGGRLLVELLNENFSRLAEVTRSDAGWSSRPLSTPTGTLISPAAIVDGNLLARIEGPLEPPRVSLLGLDGGAERVLYRQSPQFDARGMVSETWRTTSADGAPISYLVTFGPGLKRDGSAPMLVYGYGGYGVPLSPRYEPLFGKLWLERGGVYVHAYLRGGGEQGPARWRAATLKGRLQPIDDMIAVLRDLQRRGVGSPRTTGIIGRSEGGLMTAAVMQRAPELMNAVVIGGPLLDLMDPSLLNPGGPWITEHGDPRDPNMTDFIRSYSPMQNVAGAGRVYPVPLVITSTGDDRVLPGLARRFSLRLSDRGHDNLYYEDDQGGHYWELTGPPAGDWRPRARARAVEFTYLWDRLGPPTRR